MSDYDLVIRGAELVDGTGAPRRRGALAVRGGRIAAVGDVAGRGGVEIDGSGGVLAPGFVDVHSHDDFAVRVRPEMDFKVMQGVTTDVVGNCGFGAAPYPVASLMARAIHPGAELAPWDGYAGYLEAVDRDPPSLNVAALVGHGTLRGFVMGGEARAPSERELAAMVELLREGLDAGAVGFSSGLIYEPGRHARTGELVALARAMSGSGGLYATHMRDEGPGLLDSVREALRIGEEGGVAVQISHHKASGRASWGRVRESLRLVDEARGRGLDVTADQYPYTAASTVLAAVAGGLDGSDPAHALGAADVVLAAAPHDPALEGRSLAEIAAERGRTPVEVAREVLERDGGSAWVVMHLMCEDDVRTVLRHPTTMIGSDGIPTDGGKPHPRLYGTFARVLGHYGRDEGVLGLEEAVHRMTGLPAAKFGLEGRGVLREGFAADLVLFDPRAIADVATYTDPRRHPSGVRHVFVNGVAVVRDGAHTHARPGQALRRSSALQKSRSSG